MRLQVNGTQLTGLSALLADDARALDAAKVPRSDAAEFGHHRLADAVERFEATAELGVVRLAEAAHSLSDWMRLAAEVARADDEALAAEFRASGVSGSTGLSGSSVVNGSNAANPAAPTRNRGAAAAGAGSP